MRDRVTLYYELAQSATDMGGRSMTYTTYTLWADVEQMDSGQSLRYGLDTLNDNIRARTRPPATGRPVLILYNSVTYKVVSAVTDKVSQFLTIIATDAR